jgi:nicotinamide-nucleotide amidase
MTTIPNECRRIAKLLESQQRKLVLAESCTAGLVAASLGQIPGLSRYLCGSLVTYRDETKTAWLKISAATLVDPGAVSDTVALQMVLGALQATPEADLAASVTGHLGPHAPDGFDGLIFVGVARRSANQFDSAVDSVRLKSRSRTKRQGEAAHVVLTSIRQFLDGSMP